MTGAVLIAVALIMIFAGKARGMEPRKFLRIWIIAQLYVMTIIAIGILGLVFIIFGRSW
jgi:hypothetical protein